MAFRKQYSRRLGQTVVAHSCSVVVVAESLVPVVVAVVVVVEVVLVAVLLQIVSALVEADSDSRDSTAAAGSHRGY